TPNCSFRIRSQILSPSRSIVSSRFITSSIRRPPKTHSSRHTHTHNAVKLLRRTTAHHVEGDVLDTSPPMYTHTHNTHDRRRSLCRVDEMTLNRFAPSYSNYMYGTTGGTMNPAGTMNPRHSQIDSLPRYNFDAGQRMYRSTSLNSLAAASSLPSKESPISSRLDTAASSSTAPLGDDAIYSGASGGTVYSRRAIALVLCIALSLLLIVSLLAGLVVFSASGNGEGTMPPDCLQAVDSAEQAMHRMKGPQTPAGLCLTNDCVRLAANYLNNMNADVRPCDDFYEFACGRYSNSKVIPEHEKKVTVLSEMTSGLNRHLKRILEGTRDANETAPLAFARTYYESCMDNTALEEADLQPLNTLISRLGGWSLLTNSRFDSTHFQWELLAGHNALLGRSGLFHLFVHKSFERSDENMIMFAPPRLLLEKKKFYDLAPFETNEYIQKYRVYMLEFLEQLGADRDALGPHVDNILQFEMLIANATKRDNIRNHTAINNVVNWDLFLNDEIRAMLAPISEDTVVNIIDPAFFDALGALLTGNRMQIINDFLMWRLISSFEEYLPRRFRLPGHKFRLWLRGSAEEPAWETCVRIDPHPGSARFSLRRRVFYGERSESDWMDEATRTAAIAKLQQMGHKVGFPDWLFNTTHVMAPFEGVKLHAKRYFENAMALEKSQFKEMLSRLHNTRRSSSQEVWVASIIAVDAFHYFNANEIIFPAGILQFPMFVRDAPSRAIRRNGQPARVVATGHDESIPEQEAVLHHAAYHLHSTRAKKEEQRLPTFGNWTDAQMFFLAFANTWCEAVKPSAINYLLDTDVHSLGRYRVNIPLQNFPEFAKAFDCPIGAPMNPFEKCRVW
ncbi:nep-12, partial [Pristionchus pacificus]|uniref:Nep-12 n=1 Tax=Pristionchus pacificus TaxID=54126 RepID=A0A2A6CVL4_PRIPA